LRREVTLVDYGLGNLRAFQNIYARLNFHVKIATSPKIIQEAKVLILPGVGSFDWAINKLNSSGLRAALEDKVIDHQTPFLGVCVGMQLLADSSEEGVMRGLGWIPGKVKKFSTKNQITESTHDLILPHMGWNTVKLCQPSSLYGEEDKDPQKYYFLHSYYFEPSSPDHALATTDYGAPFASVVGKKNVYGVQFHPEKSHRWGIGLLKKFAEIC